MSAVRHGWIGLVVCALLSSSGACATARRPAPGPDALDPKFSIASYIEEGAEVALIVGTRPTGFKEDEPYVPFEIAIVNKGLERLSLTRESFTLVDEEGNEYPAVGRDELARSYGNVDLDRRLGEIGPIVRGRFQAYTQVPSVLTPSFDKPIDRRLYLRRFNFAVDFLYFPRPATGVRGRRFELFMRAPELEAPVFVKLRVHGKPRSGS